MNIWDISRDFKKYTMKKAAMYIIPRILWACFLLVVKYMDTEFYKELLKSFLQWLSPHILTSMLVLSVILFYFILFFNYIFYFIFYILFYFLFWMESDGSLNHHEWCTKRELS